MHSARKGFDMEALVSAAAAAAGDGSDVTAVLEMIASLRIRSPSASPSLTTT